MFKKNHPQSQETQSGVKKNRFWLRTILNFLVYLAIIAGIVIGLPRLLARTLKTTYPMASITSSSMWPALKEGDLVFVQGVPSERIKHGDIIVYRNGTGGGFTIHRVVRIKGDTLITKGDANFNEDAPIAFKDVVGRTLTIFDKPVHIPYLGSITVFASNLKDDRRAKKEIR